MLAWSLVGSYEGSVRFFWGFLLLSSLNSGEPDEETQKADNPTPQTRNRDQS